MDKLPVHLMDINTKSDAGGKFRMMGHVILPNKHILAMNHDDNKVVQIGTTRRTCNKIISELNLPGRPFDITRMTANKVAVTMYNPNQIQMVSVSQNALALGKAIPVQGECKGIAYNEKDKTFVLSFNNPAKVEIIDLSGNVVTLIEKDANGCALFDLAYYVALTPDRSGIYVSDSHHKRHSVTLMTLTGEVKAVFKDERLSDPMGLCVHDKSGLVYVVGYHSQTVHVLEPEGGEFKRILEVKDGIYNPWSISYCDLEDKLYVGLFCHNCVKVYQM